MFTKTKVINTGIFWETYVYKYPIFYGYSISPSSSGSEVSITKSKTKVYSGAYRAKSQVRRMVQGNIRVSSERPKFLTLTFHENKTDLQETNKEFTKFIKRLGTRYKEKQRYIAVPEFQKRGAVHYHAIMFNMPFTETRVLEGLWKHGFVKVKEVNRASGLALYLVKYISKSFADKRLKYKRRYFHSLWNYPEMIRNEQKAESIAKFLGQVPPLKVSGVLDIRNDKGEVVNQYIRSEYFLDR
jgi:hypothetical protein